MPMNSLNYLVLGVMFNNLYLHCPVPVYVIILQVDFLMYIPLHFTTSRFSKVYSNTFHHDYLNLYSYNF